MNNDVQMSWLNWGPFVGKFKLEDSIIKRLHNDGKKKLQCNLHSGTLMGPAKLYNDNGKLKTEIKNGY